MNAIHNANAVLARAIGLNVIEMNAYATIGLCVKNGANVVQTAFDSISIQDYPHELLKLVIVDDGSTDNTLSIVAKFAQETDIRTIVASSKGRGLGVTRQTVVDNAEGDYILWVDDDLVLSSDFVRNQVEFMERNPNVGAARGRLDEFLTQPIMRIVDFVHLLPDPQPLNQIGMCGSILRCKAMGDVGGFDVRIRGAGEDLDVSRRIRGSGWRLATNNSAGVHHMHRIATLRNFLKRYSWYGYGNHFLFHKYRDRRFLLTSFPPYFLLSGLKMTLAIYRLTAMKKAFLFLFFNSLGMIVQSFGFARANLDGYGHVDRV